MPLSPAPRERRVTSIFNSKHRRRWWAPVIHSFWSLKIINRPLRELSTRNFALRSVRSRASYAAQDYKMRFESCGSPLATFGDCAGVEQALSHISKASRYPLACPANSRLCQCHSPLLTPSFAGKVANRELGPESVLRRWHQADERRNQGTGWWRGNKSQHRCQYLRSLPHQVCPLTTTSGKQTCLFDLRHC